MATEKIAILGASSGLGSSLAQLFSQKGAELFLSSRKEEKLLELSRLVKNPTVVASDFTKPEDQENLLSSLEKFKADHIIYTAGAGTYGAFENKKWDAHLWTFELNFLFPAKLIYEVLKQEKFKNVKSIIYIGSQVAGNKGDPNAASYSASKHAMRGLITSIQEEKTTSSCHVRIFSAPYMDTGMLPPKAWPRQVEGMVQPVSVVSEIFYRWFLETDNNYE